MNIEYRDMIDRIDADSEIVDNEEYTELERICKYCGTSIPTENYTEHLQEEGHLN